MNYDQIYAISAAGMAIERLRLDVVAYNIANQNSIQKPGTKGYSPLTVEIGNRSFPDYIETPTLKINDIRLVPQGLPPEKIYQPEHPAADKQGFVHYAGINMVNEMTTLLRASHAYEANIKMINAIHSLVQQTLTIGEER